VSTSTPCVPAFNPSPRTDALTLAVDKSTSALTLNPIFASKLSFFKDLIFNSALITAFIPSAPMHTFA
ncbi:unnamed protein product, partial [Rotaria sp. Silwood1]